MKWPYNHKTFGHCILECPMYGFCHCGCGGKTNLDHKHPYVFIAHHHRPTQWSERERTTARCHPDRAHHAWGLCMDCYWRDFGRVKRANKKQDREMVTAWERIRYRRFLELIAEGFEIAPAIRQLERDVPSEMLVEEAAQ